MGEKRDVRGRLIYLMLAVSALLAGFAVIAQPDRTLLAGFLKIQVSEAGLITDPMAVGGVGAALLNAALVLLLCTLLVRGLKVPFTGVSFACLFMMAGFALLGKNLVNITPIIAGGWLHALYKRESFAKYVYLTLFGTCLSPIVSFFLVNGRPGTRWLMMAFIGLVIGFLLPAVAGFTVRVHQGYNLYNVGFAAGFLGLGLASILKGFGVEFTSHSTWSEEGHVLLCVMMAVILGGLFIAGIWLGCRSWRDYRRILRHSGRAVADFILLDPPGRCFVNMALVGAVGFAYLLCVGVKLNGPLVCCLLSMVGFAAFGKHPKNIVPLMAGAVLSALLLEKIPLTSPGVLLATLLCTGLAPIAGQFGWYWGVAAGFIHMAIVQNTSFLHGGMNLYNNGFAAGLVCVLLIPIIEAVKSEPEGVKDMKKRMSMARRKMSHVIDELYTALFLAGGKEVDLRIVKEEDGLRLLVQGDFSPEHRKKIEGLRELLCPEVRNPALVGAYWELAGRDQYTSDSELALVGQMLDGAEVAVEEGRVEMRLYLAF